MPSPFPGMDPFIESQAWKGFHTSFLVALSELLVAEVRPRYIVSVQQHHLTPGGEDRGEAAGVNGRPDDGWLPGSACARPCRDALPPGTGGLRRGGSASRRRAAG